jgi:hypothetical protein
MLLIYDREGAATAMMLERMPRITVKYVRNRQIASVSVFADYSYYYLLGFFISASRHPLSRLC